MNITESTAKSVECLDPRTSLIRAARLMSEANVGCITVVERGRVVGVITDRDIVVRAVAAGINPVDSTVGENMTTLADLARAPLAYRPTSGDGEGGALLRGELAAVEMYRMAIGKLGESEAGETLRRLADEHLDAVRLLRQRMVDLDLDPPEDAGLWGALAEAVEGAAQLLGSAAAVEALKDGEERGIRSYRRALDDERLTPETKALIRDTLLPRTWSRVSALDALLKVEAGI